MLSKIELQTVAKLVDSLDHYKILKVDPLATEDEIRDAFHKEALSFHPDQYFSDEESERGDLAKKIYARIVAAYRELSNPKSRQAYDKKMKFSTTGDQVSPAEDDFGGDGEGFDEVTTSIRHKPSWASKGPGEKFFQLAEKAYASRDLRSALMNVQIALSAEPDNPRFLRFKQDLEKQIEKQS